MVQILKGYHHHMCQESRNYFISHLWSNSCRIRFLWNLFMRSVIPSWFRIPVWRNVFNHGNPPESNGSNVSDLTLHSKAAHIYKIRLLKEQLTRDSFVVVFFRKFVAFFYSKGAPSSAPFPVFRIRINFFRIRIQSLRLETNTEPDPDPGLKKKLNFFLSKTAIYLSLGLHKVCPSYRRSLQLTKEAIQHFKTWIFSTFVGQFCPPGSWSGFRIRIRIHWPDWIRIQSGSGSETLALPTPLSLHRCVYIVTYKAPSILVDNVFWSLVLCRVLPHSVPNLYFPLCGRGTHSSPV